MIPTTKNIIYALAFVFAGGMFAAIAALLAGAGRFGFASVSLIGGVMAACLGAAGIFSMRQPRPFYGRHEIGQGEDGRGRQ